MRNIRTDLALENHEAFKDSAKELNGVTLTDKSVKGLKISHVEIKTEEAAKSMQKPIGNYITLETPDLRYIDKKQYEKIVKAIFINKLYFYIIITT